MKTRHSIFIAACFGLAALLSACGAAKPPSPTLKDALKGKFYIGTAMNEGQITGVDTAGVRVIKEQFNSIVAENCMKSEEIHPEKGHYDFSLADKFVDFGEQNGMWIIGHTLVWHSQLPEWFTVDDEGNDVSRDELIARMRDHIHTVVGRYKGRVNGWDVVNEAINDDGSIRKSKFYRIIGEDFIKLAFQFAHEADPDAELYYNDFSMDIPAKRDGVVKLVNDLKAAGMRVDGIGMQGHLGMDFPALEDFERSIEVFGATGLKVMITELDMSALPNPHKVTGAEVSANFDYQKEFNPYTEGLPESQMTAWNNRMADVFRILLRHQDKISRVTLWGVADGDSWKNDWPVRGRTDYALLFDRNHQPKAVVRTIIEEAMKQ